MNEKTKKERIPLSEVKFRQPVKYYPSSEALGRLMTLKREYQKTASEIIDLAIMRWAMDYSTFRVTVPSAVAEKAEILANRLGYSSAQSWIQDSLSTSIPESLREMVKNEGDYEPPWKKK